MSLGKTIRKDTGFLKLQVKIRVIVTDKLKVI